MIKKREVIVGLKFILPCSLLNLVEVLKPNLDIQNPNCLDSLRNML